MSLNIGSETATTLETFDRGRPQSTMRCSLTSLSDHRSQFDNETASPVAGVSAVGIYNGINYDAFNLAQVSATSGYVAKSPPNAAGVALTGSLSNGDLTLSPVATASIAGTNTKFFDLIQFYFACAFPTAESDAGVATGCDISVTGYNTEGQMVGDASFNYAPASLEGASMALAQLPSTFVGLVNVTFGIADASIATALTALALDNIEHVNYW